MIKKLLILFLTLSFTPVIALANSHLPSPKSSIEPLDQIVAIVNDGLITERQVNAAYQNALEQAQAQGINLPNPSTLKNEILNQLIDQELQVQLAKRNKLEVTEAQLTQAIKNIAQQHKMSVSDLKQKVIAQGTPYPIYRQAIKKQILISMVQRQALGKNMQVSQADIKQFLQKYQSQKKVATQYHVIDARVPLPSTPTPTQLKQAQAQALKISTLLQATADYSKIKGAEVNDLGWRTQLELPDLFLKHITKMKPNHITHPVLAPNGYHVLKLVNIKKSQTPLPSHEQIKTILMQQKFQKALSQWIVQLRQQSYVKIVRPPQ